MESSGQKRRFPPPWRIERVHDDHFDVVDANGVTLASVAFRPELNRWRFSSGHLAEDEAVKIAKAITRLPEFLMQRRGFYPRGGGQRWKASRPYHVAIEDAYLRTHWSLIDAMCKQNGIPISATGEVIEGGGHWRVHEFAWQLDAMQFWDAFEGRWLRGDEFHYPERTADFPKMKPIEGWPKFDPKKLLN